MKNLFSMNQLMAANPCEDGLDRLTSGLGTYSGKTMVTVDDLKPLTASDILWCLKLLPIIGLTHKMIAVKTAVHAAELVAHLTEDPYAARCLESASDARASLSWAEWSTTWAGWAVRQAEMADPTTEPKMKAHLIQLIRDQS